MDTKILSFIPAKSWVAFSIKADGPIYSGMVIGRICPGSYVVTGVSLPDLAAYDDRAGGDLNVVTVVTRRRDQLTLLKIPPPKTLLDVVKNVRANTDYPRIIKDAFRPGEE